MYFHNSTSILAVATLFIASVNATAETPEALVREALQGNPELKSYVAEIAVAKGAAHVAGMHRNPDLNTQTGYKHSKDDSNGSSGTGVAWNISLSQTFEYPGRIALRKAIASHDVQLAELHLQQFRLKLGARVRTLAYGIASAVARSSAAHEVAERIEAVTNVLKQRPTVGTAQQLETQIVSANAAAFRRQERGAALEQATITAELNNLCGRPVSAPLNLKSRTVHFRALSIAKLLQAGRTHALEIRIRQTELTQQGFKVALSKNERYPTVAVSPYYSLETAIDTEQQIGLGISLPLPLWDRNAGNIAVSKARQQQAEAALAMTQREIERQITQNAATLAAKRTESENLSVDSLTKSKDAAQLADRDYQRGVIPLTTYVETQKQYLELVGAATDLEKEALQAALELEVLTGLKLYHGDQDND